jgi:hypothetical protein
MPVHLCAPVPPLGQVTNKTRTAAICPVEQEMRHKEVPQDDSSSAHITVQPLPQHQQACPIVPSRTWLQAVCSQQARHHASNVGREGCLRHTQVSLQRGRQHMRKM